MYRNAASAWQVSGSSAVYLLLGLVWISAFSRSVTTVVNRIKGNKVLDSNGTAHCLLCPNKQTLCISA